MGNNPASEFIDRLGIRNHWIPYHLSADGRYTLYDWFSGLSQPFRRCCNVQLHILKGTNQILIQKNSPISALATNESDQLNSGSPSHLREPLNFIIQEVTG